MNKKVIIFSRATGYGAPQRRIDNLITMLNECGFICYLVTFDLNHYKDIVKIKDGLFHISLGQIDTNKFTKLKRLFFGSGFVNYSFKYVNPNLVLISSTIWNKTANFIKKKCHKRKIPLIFDVVEFRYKPKFLTPKTIIQYDYQNWKINSKVISQNDNVLCISHYLKDFFDQKKCNTFYYPITFATETNIKRNNFLDKKVRFLYAGTPDNGRDLIANIVSGFAMLKANEIENLELYICGPSFETLLKEGVRKTDIQKLGKSLIVKGKLPINELYSLMETVDFSVLLKDPKKLFSVAGFPTKMAESFSKCIPMVCNLTGDMIFFAKNEVNCIVCESYDAQEFSVMLKKAMNLKANNNLYMDMSNSAFSVVSESLNTEKFSIMFMKFLNELNISKLED
ncbi:MAG: hypothetical protein HUJ68_09880 [Clostridia bacterium]|nr:hypothetical protein [Clostridia bacterium]